MKYTDPQEKSKNTSHLLLTSLPNLSVNVNYFICVIIEKWQKDTGWGISENKLANDPIRHSNT